MGVPNPLIPTAGAAAGAAGGIPGGAAGAGGSVILTAGSGGNAYNSAYTQTYTPSPAPKWKERHYVMKDAEDESVGIYKGPVDVTTVENFTLYMPEQECTFEPLTFQVIHKLDYETHVAFETLPVLSVERHAAGGILLKLPPNKLVVCD